MTFPLFLALAPTTVGLLLFVVLALVLVARGIKIVRQAEIMLVERLGKFHRSLEPGLNVLWPIIDKARAVSWMQPAVSGGRSMTVIRMRDRLDLREVVLDFPQQRVITRDNVLIEINGLLFAQITDPLRSAYEVNNLPNAIEKLAQTTLRNIIGELDLDKCLSSRDEINARMREVLDEATDKWGVKVNRVELQDISPPPEIQVAMEKQMQAERSRRAVVLEAEGAKTAQVLRAEGVRDAAVAEAEGERKRLILKAEGEAGAIGQVTAALKDAGTDPAQYLIAMEYLKMMRDIAQSPSANNTVFMPYESAGVLGSLGSIKEVLGAVGGPRGGGLT
ncbi:MAG: SPFH/Band 7/PHB domain protein [Planctomycetota bacterium]|nr:MAG: SPFH/Band 7/PHB domain protein [Planctomycetota bacterium]